MGYTPFKYKFRQGKRYHLKKKLKQKAENGWLETRNKQSYNKKTFKL